MRFCLAALVVALFIAAAWLVDPFLLIILGVAPLVWIGLPAALVASILLVVSLRTGGSRRLALRTLAVVGAFACFVGLVIPTNHFVQGAAVSDAKAYPARVAPLLEAYRKEHGVYPASLDQLPTIPPVPRLLRRYGYHSSGQSYSFTFAQPGGLIDTWDFNSETQTWHLST